MCAVLRNERILRNEGEDGCSDGEHYGYLVGVWLIGVAVWFWRWLIVAQEIDSRGGFAPEIQHCEAGENGYTQKTGNDICSHSTTLISLN